MQYELTLLAARASAGSVVSLPLQSFDMEVQHELAFRTLQGGLNTGKIVVRVAFRPLGGASDGHVVTGGTGAIGEAVCRGLAARGAELEGPAGVLANLGAKLEHCQYLGLS